MAYRTGRNTLRAAQLIGGIAAALISGTSYHAEASDACNGFTQTGSLGPATQVFFTSTNFVPGDRIVGSITGTKYVLFYLRDETTGLKLTPDDSVGVTQISYVVTRSTAKHKINIYINNVIPEYPGNAYSTLRYSFSCRSAGLQ